MDDAKRAADNASGNAKGNRNDGGISDTLNSAGPLSKTPSGPIGAVQPSGEPKPKPTPSEEGKEDKDKNAGFGLDNFEKDVKGSLKVHIKLDLEVDIRIIARVRGDIAIGLL